MAKRVIVSSIWILEIVVLALLSSHADAIACEDAIRKLLPCQSYLVGSGSISAPCCQSAQALNQIANSKPQRKSLTECFKRVAPAIGVKVDRAKQLPDLCKIKLPVTIDPNVDCNKV